MTKVRTKKSNASSVHPRNPARTALRWFGPSTAFMCRELYCPMADTPSGERPARQPVHTVYGGAHLFTSDTTAKLGAIALRTLREYAPDATALATALGFDRDLTARLYPRLVEKLEREAVEDYRIDFEDGFGSRPDAEEDAAATKAATQVAAGMDSGSLPPAIGIRIKNLGAETKRRGLRTFELFLSTVVRKTGGRLPPNFVVTLPKITAPDQVSALVDACGAFESSRKLAGGTLRFEVMIETPESVFSRDGRIALPEFIARGQGRITAAHFGTYDYTASMGITAAHQNMLHPSCDFAKHVMQVSLSGTDVWLSDGATNVMPVAPHRAAPGATLSASERSANTAVIHAAWKLHADHVRHSLEGGSVRRLPPRDSRLDQPERLLRRDEDLVGIVEAERLEVDQQVVAVRQRELDVDDASARGQRGFSHRIKRLLHRFAPVGGERLDERGSDRGPHREIRKTSRVAPGGRDRRCQNAIASLGKRRVLVARKPGKRGGSRFQDHQTAETGGHGSASRVARHHRRPLLAAGARKRMRMRPTAGRQPLPWVLSDVDPDERHTWLRREVFRQPRRKRLDMIDPIAPGERVHGVLHRVGGETCAVVAVQVDRIKGAFERDIERELDEVVRIGAALAFHEPHLRLPVSIPREEGGHYAPRYVEYPYGLRSSGM